MPQNMTVPIQITPVYLGKNSVATKATLWIRFEHNPGIDLLLSKLKFPWHYPANFAKIGNNRESFFTVSQGIFETNIVISSNLQAKVEKIFKNAVDNGVNLGERFRALSFCNDTDECDLMWRAYCPSGGVRLKINMLKFVESIDSSSDAREDFYVKSIILEIQK